MDKQELADSYRQWYRPLLVYACTLTGDRAAAEDLVQSAFLKALLSYRGVRGELRFWLLRVLRNEWISYCRKNAHVSDVPPPDAAGGPDPLEELLRTEAQRQVYAAVRALPVRYREVLLQSTLLDLSDREIARIHGISPENIRKLRSRAREKLKEQIKEEEP